MKKVFEIKAFILAIEMALAFCFFWGIFWNHLVGVEVFNEKSWYYINRGYPISWAGVSKPSLSVDFPIIKAPFLTRKVYGESYAKIIDLRIFVPFFTIVFLIGYFFLRMVFISLDVSKLAFYLFWPGVVVLGLADIFFYFFWFPRI